MIENNQMTIWHIGQHLLTPHVYWYHLQNSNDGKIKYNSYFLLASLQQHYPQSLVDLQHQSLEQTL